MFGVFSARTQDLVSPSNRRSNDARFHMEIGCQHTRESRDRDEELSGVAYRRRLPLKFRVEVANIVYSRVIGSAKGTGHR